MLFVWHQKGHPTCKNYCSATSKVTLWRFSLANTEKHGKQSKNGWVWSGKTVSKATTVKQAHRLGQADAEIQERNLSKFSNIITQNKTLSHLFYLLGNCSNSNVVGEKKSSLHAIKEWDPIQLCVSISKELSNAILQEQSKTDRLEIMFIYASCQSQQQHSCYGTENHYTYVSISRNKLVHLSWTL